MNLRLSNVCVLVALWFVPGPAFGAGKESPSVVIIDQAGKEIALTNWKFTLGTKHLSWLDPTPPVKGKGKKVDTTPRGPEYLETREFKTPMFQNDVTTFVPLSALRTIEWDYAKKGVRVTLAAADGKNLVLAGSTEFIGINRFNVEGDVAMGSLSIAGPFKLHDGYAKAGVQSIRFPAGDAVAAPTGARATVIVRGKEKTKHEVFGLMPLYSASGGQELIATLMFQKTVKMDWSDIARMTHIAPKDKKTGGLLDFDVEKRDGTKLGLTLLDKGVMLEEKKVSTLLGLVGRVAAGYRLFPATIIEEVSVGVPEKK